jgi:Mn2+/Fe2+ NRAMP family transporter
VRRAADLRGVRCGHHWHRHAALPALAGSAAYALGEILSWHVGLARLPRRAKAFYATITVGMALGVALNFSAIDPIRALYWSAVLNGVVAVPLVVMMMRLTMRPSVMAGFTLEGKQATIHFFLSSWP